MRYYSARVYEGIAEEAYRIYISDSLKLYGEGKRTTMRYINIIKPVPEDDRDADVIISNIKDKLNKISFNKGDES